MQKTPLQKTIIVIGDISGKTSTIKAYTQDEFCESYTTIFDKFEADVEVDGTCVEVEIIDTTNGDKFSVIRKTMYPSADVVIIFFSIYSRTSYNKVREVWIPEVMNSCPKLPFILVTTLARTGLYDGERVSSEEGESLAEEIGAYSFVECWADRKYNVEKVFVEAVSAALKEDKNNRSNLTVDS